MRSSLLILGAAIAAGSVATGDLTAQSTVRGNLIGYTAATASPSTTPPLIQRQRVCGPVERVCPAGNLAPATDWAGGLAYDGTIAGYWFTQGTRITQHRLQGCQLECAFPAELTLGAQSVATGLAFVESSHTLYQLESVPGAAALHTFSTLPCPPFRTGTCNLALPSLRHIAGAVAIDQRNGYVLYGASVFVTPTPTNSNIILVAQLTDPCNVVCRIPVGDCSAATPFGAIRGMAYDDCDGVLYVTDGDRTIVLRRSGFGPARSTRSAAARSARPARAGAASTSSRSTRRRSARAARAPAARAAAAWRWSRTATRSSATRASQSASSTGRPTGAASSRSTSAAAARRSCRSCAARSTRPWSRPQR
ncbi:MAG: hypothetical protein IPM29_02815 [Planctomycetes bacterium]|nr:hypothetical protein [Planctomycetota bacterium]